MRCPDHFQHGEVDEQRGGHGVRGWEVCRWRGCAEFHCPAERRDSGHYCDDHKPRLGYQPVIDGPQA